MKLIIAFLVFISCTAIANILMKIGVSGKELKALGFIDILMSWRILLGLGLFGIAIILWLLILRRLPLSVAQSFSAAQFIAVIVASRIILAEPIAGVQWFGMGLIALGIVVVGWQR